MTAETRTPAKTRRPAARAAAPAAAETAAPAAPAATAASGKTLDLRAVLDKLKLPGVDVPALIESRRKDVEALLAANEQAYRGFEAVTRRQAEMLAEAMKGLTESAKDTLATKGTTQRAARVSDHVQQAFSHALADMKEIAEMSARSQKQVVETLSRRMRESIEELGERIGKKKAPGG